MCYAIPGRITSIKGKRATIDYFGEEREANILFEPRGGKLEAGNYVYAQGAILFHCALEGKKLDEIRANPQVCFTVGHMTGRVRDHAQDPCQLDSDSVICYGRARLVDTIEERQTLLDVFNRRFDPDAAPISAQRAGKCGVVVIEIDEMTGRREREEGQTFWRYRFG